MNSFIWAIYVVYNASSNCGLFDLFVQTYEHIGQDYHHLCFQTDKIIIQCDRWKMIY